MGVYVVWKLGLHQLKAIVYMMSSWENIKNVDNRENVLAKLQQDLFSALKTLRKLKCKWT